MLNLDKIMEEYRNKDGTSGDSGEHICDYIYHFCVIEGIKVHDFVRYGLCSPGKLADNDLGMFRNVVMNRHIGVAARVLGKDRKDIGVKEVLKFLDFNPKSGKYFSRETIFFSFLPYSMLPGLMFRGSKRIIEVKIRRDSVKTCRPVLISPGGRSRYTNWNYLKSPGFMNLVEQQAYKRPDPDDIWRFISYLGLDCGHIPAHKLSEIREIRV